MLPAEKIVLLLILWKRIRLTGSIADPTISCRKFVPEGDPLTCECEVRSTEAHPPDFSLTWPGRSSSEILELPTVKRSHNGTSYICLLVWNGEKRTASYTLQVAYGPDDSHTSIQGPDSFVTDGSRTLNLTCKAIEVNPSPIYTWDTDRCDTQDQNTGTCSLVPQVPWDDGMHLQCSARSREGNSNKGTRVFRVSLAYPPSTPPVMKTYRPNNVIYFEEPVGCAVSGGKPVVSDITVSCNHSGMSYTGSTAESADGKSASRSFTFDTGLRGITPVSCTCAGEWTPDRTLYKEQKTATFLIKPLPEKPTVSCTTFTPEGQAFSCECHPGPGENSTDSFPLTWSGLSSATLHLPSVSRSDNGTTFTCLVTYDGPERSASYTLQVAYGPDADHTQILGPVTFITNGTMALTLICNATEVNPTPKYTWNLDRCRSSEADGISTCTFVPRPLSDDAIAVLCNVTNSVTGRTATADITVNLRYPPPDPPRITGFRGEGESLSAGTILWCNVSGGEPLVSEVIFSCQQPDLPDELDFFDGQSVSSPLTINRTLDATEYMRCWCRAVWQPQPEMYSGIATVGGSGEHPVLGKMFIIIIASAGAAVVVTVIVVVLVIYCHRRRGAKTRRIQKSEEDMSLSQNEAPKKKGKLKGTEKDVSNKLLRRPPDSEAERQTPLPKEKRCICFN